MAPPFGLAQQMQMQQNYLKQALMAGRVSPYRYQQLMNRMNRRQSFLQQHGQWPGAEQAQGGPASSASPPGDPFAQQRQEEEQQRQQEEQQRQRAENIAGASEAKTGPTGAARG